MNNKQSETENVIIRQFKDNFINKMDFILFFPDRKTNYKMIESFIWIGQHGQASIDYYHTTKKVKIADYPFALNFIKKYENIYMCKLKIKERLNYKQLTLNWIY